MTRVIAITGGKGGVGKTNISVNLALVLAELGHRVCLFDADLGLANINVLLGIYPEHDLEDVILNSKSISDILIRNYQGIDIIPGSSGVERLANLSQEDIDRIVQSFASLDAYDYFILDTSAGISRSVISFCLAATDVALVITPEPTSLTDAYALLKVLCFNDFRGKPKIIVNQCKNTSQASAAYNKLKEVVHKYLTLDIVPLGIIVRDKKFPEAVQRQQPLVHLYPQSSAAKCLQVIAARIVANKPEPFSATGMTGFWSKFLSIARMPLKLPEKPEPQQIQTDATHNNQPLLSEPAPSAGEPLRAETPTATPPVPPLHEHEVPMQPESPRTTVSGSIFDFIEHKIQLPTLPNILIRLLDACGNDATDMRDIADIIEKDPALCSRILRLVNSSYYSLSHKITHFDQALTLLGIDAVRNIAISASVYQVFNTMQNSTSFDVKAFWWHSLKCAVTAQLIAKAISYTRPDEAFLAGLLHDIGKAVQVACGGQSAATPLTKTAAGGQMPEHHEIGAWLAGQWHLQPLIADAILYHHESPARIMHALPLVKIVYGANLLSAEPAEPSPQVRASTAQLLDIEQQTIDDIAVQASEQVVHIAQSLEIELSPFSPDHAVRTEQDDRAATRLTHKVRDLSLLQGTLQQFITASDIDTLLRSAYDGFALLLHISAQHTRIFVYDADQQILIGTAPHTPLLHDHINELTIPTATRTSLVSTSVAECRSIDSFSYAQQSMPTIIDEQLIRILGKQGMVCFPLSVHHTPVGAVTVGVNRDELDALHEDRGLLNLLLGQLAFALEAEIMRQKQSKKILAERLSAATAVAKKVAHEVNNPLSIIKNYLKILDIKLADHNIPTEELTIINEEIDRVSGIIDSLSDFSRSKIQTLAPVHINALINDLVMITEPTLAQQHIMLVFTPDATVPPILSDKNGLKQIIINLIKNAAEALSGGGTISIATHYIPDQSSIKITITDNGPGLPDSVKNRLFEPYISTKGRGHAGLGLSIVYGVIQELHGTISCSSEKGRGTTFSIILPVAAQQSG
ncbi:MAG: HDOD domain-containing protein [Desulfobacterota bacterium]|nr:HDOD domain-containing protein [Thermodesulfobacteriota bacterium]